MNTRKLVWGAMDNEKPHLQKACELAGGQTALAKKIGRDQGYIWHLMNCANSIKADIAFKIADATGIPVRDIIADFEAQSTESEVA